MREVAELRKASESCKKRFFPLSFRSKRKGSAKSIALAEKNPHPHGPGAIQRSVKRFFFLCDSTTGPRKTATARITVANDAGTSLGDIRFVKAFH